jgi:hypothetical protein
MKRIFVVAVFTVACGPSGPVENYGFVARLGNDTVSVERVTRRGNRLTSDEVDRFPRVRQRHTEIEVAPDGGIRHLTMDIQTPSEAENQRDRKVVVNVTKDSVLITKTDKSGTVRRAFATRGAPAMAHLPQMYSLYELYFEAALGKAKGVPPGPGDTVRLRQFYIDREFDRFPLHSGVVRFLPAKTEIFHDWLSGIGEATLDSTGRLLKYSGARTTYKVDVARVTDLPDVQAVGTQFAAAERNGGSVRQLSVRDTLRASVGSASFTVDYGRPLVRGRALVGNILPYDRVWRTGANAATQFTTTAPITLAGVQVPTGTYTLWTVPRVNGAADIVLNKQTGQWGTEYDGAQNLFMTPMKTETLTTPVEMFTISISSADATHGTLALEWGPFRWTSPIVVQTQTTSAKGR